MEPASAIKIFRRSIPLHGLTYNHFGGDGDIIFKEVVDNKPYAQFNIIPQKLECVGHVHKRIGSWLRAKDIEYKKTSTSISDKRELTEKTINSMQNYYGAEIRQNLDQI